MSKENQELDDEKVDFDMWNDESNKARKNAEALGVEYKVTIPTTMPDAFVEPKKPVSNIRRGLINYHQEQVMELVIKCKPRKTMQSAEQVQKFEQAMEALLEGKIKFLDYSRTLEDVKDKLFDLTQD